MKSQQTIASRDKLREKLKQDIEDFLQKGGEIEKVEKGMSGGSTYVYGNQKKGQTNT